MSDQKLKIKELENKVRELILSIKEKDAKIRRMSLGHPTDGYPLELVLEQLDVVKVKLETGMYSARLTGVVNAIVDVQGKVEETQRLAFQACEDEMLKIHEETWVESGYDGAKGVEAFKVVSEVVNSLDDIEGAPLREKLHAFAEVEGSTILKAVIGEEKYLMIQDTQREVMEKLNSCKSREEEMEYVKSLQAAAIEVNKKIQANMKENPEGLEEFLDKMPDADKQAMLRMRVIQDLFGGQNRSHGHSHNGEPCHGHGDHGHSHEQAHGHSHGGEPCHGHGH